MITLRRPPVRELGIEALLQWTFGEQAARLEVREESWERAACGTEWVIWQRGAVLGCAIDGGRGFLPDKRHDDAETVAGVVAACLPSYRSFWVAQLARAGRRPDALICEVPRCVPRSTHHNRYGTRSKTVPALTALFPGAWGPTIPMRRGNRRRVFRSEVCPVTYEPTRQQIDAARRAYLEWWAALHEVRRWLLASTLRDHRLTGTMPPVAPWEAGG